MTLGRLVGKPSSYCKYGFKDEWRHGVSVRVPLVIEKDLVENWHVGVDVHKVHVEVVQYGFFIWHQLRRYSHFEIGT